MNTLLYNPKQDLIWLGCSYDEVRKHFIKALDADGLRTFIELNRQWDSDRRLQHASNVMGIYGIDYFPDIFILASRDLRRCSIHDQYYPFSIGIPEGTFQECDHIELDEPDQLRRLILTHDCGEAFTNKANIFEKRKLYIDMDGTIVDFGSGLRKVPVEVQREYWDHPEDIEGVFSLMEPMSGAEDAIKALDEYYDCFILSTAPWNNPGAWADKIRWIQKHFGDLFYKKVVLTHRKDLLSDGESILVDDRHSHGADAFGTNLVDFVYEEKSWPKMAGRLIRMAQSEGTGIKY